MKLAMLKRFFRIVIKIVVALLVVVGVLCVIYRDLVGYGLRQAKGQLTIVRKAKPVEEYLSDPAFPDSLKQKLLLIAEARQFAINSLGLNDTKNYTTMYDQQGKEIMWVVTASEPFQLKEKEWKFPVVGAMPYKGYFDEARARAEQKQLEDEGWDVNVRNPGGWSTLGWFTDPILSNMLSRSEGDLVSLIIHEMVHATIFVKDSVDFNENLASFIGDRGAEQFLISKYGKDSEPYHQFVQEDKEYINYVDHILRGCVYLDSVYAAMADKPVEEKKQLKEAAILKIMETADTLSFDALIRPGSKHKTLPNNAYFMSFRRYQSRQDVFHDEWQQNFRGDLKAYILYLADRYPFL
ncbi:MAG: aminopeptidase [Cyclobacteriaceae bacterium]|nr:aminopeptidase [Cyclobacteriaceae bacterium]